MINKFKNINLSAHILVVDDDKKLNELFLKYKNK